MKQCLIKTPRLTAKFIEDHNQHHVIDLYNKKHSTKFLQGIDPIQDIKLSKQCYESYDKIGSYLIFENNTNNFVGFGGVQKQEPMFDGSFVIDNDIEFLIILDEKFNGLGYASEFSKEFLKTFFATLPHKSIPARVHKENLACKKLLEKIGFITQGEVDYHDYGNKYLLLEANSHSWQLVNSPAK